jgi:hypothetical protein
MAEGPSCGPLPGFGRAVLRFACSAANLVPVSRREDESLGRLLALARSIAGRSLARAVTLLGGQVVSHPSAASPSLLRLSIGRRVPVCL